MSELPSRASIKDSLKSLGGDSEPTAEGRVLEEISARVTQNSSEVDAMRIELYLMDVIGTVQGGGQERDGELLEKVRQGSGFADLNTVMNIPDETTLFFISEVREKLSSQSE